MKSMFKLEKYKGRNSRHTCPKCGKQRCFTRYIDENGEILHPEVGRCDHESSCGYHYTPKDYFRDHPQVDISIERRMSKQNLLFPRRKMNNTIKTINTIDSEYVRRSVRPEIDSDFTLFLRTILTDEQVSSLINEYQLGVTSSGDVIFFEIDIDGKCRTGKIMKYDRETGHRIKDESQPNRINWVHSELKRAKNLPQDWTVTQCLFGEHLLARYPEKTVVLVEAEKTAVICAAFMPEYIWLATGGKSQLNDRVRVLTGRKVFAFPDMDAISEWRQKAALYPEVNIQVSSLLNQHTTSSSVNQTMDIADWILEWARTNKIQLFQIDNI